MVGIVIVSHSSRIAEGVRELAQQMTQEEIAIAIAGGVDDPEHPIGTDASKVQAAIESVYSEDGVLVLMDLGSALMSAETALDFLPEEQRANIILSAAPLVEGAMAAAVQAAVEGSLQQVRTEAEGALAAKEQQIGGATAVFVSEPPPPPADLTHELHLTVTNKLGLHARPAARFVTVANRFQSVIRVEKEEETANAKSINQVATLGVNQGDEIRIVASGVDAEAALEAFQALADANFGDEDGEGAGETAVSPATPPDVQMPLAEGELSGIAASPGIAIGPVFQYRPVLPPVETHSVDDAAEEWKRLQAALAAAQREIDVAYAEAQRQLGDDEAEIFQAHALILQDPDLLEAVHETLREERINVEAAWQRALQATAVTYREMDDPYMQARAADVEDVGNQVLRQLMDVSLPSLQIDEPSILVAPDLTPSDTARLDPDKVIGICTERGGATSHSAILARALGIPAVVGLGSLLDALQPDQMLAMNGSTGQVWVDPDYETLATLEAEQQAWVGEQLQAKAMGQKEAVTEDGRKLEIAANIGGPNDVSVALEYGAEGVGLFRTEFLFLGRSEAPDEEEQAEVYRAVAAQMEGRPLIIRTLDIGGDKPLPYIDLGPEDNPFLGWRGIRFCLDHPELFRPHLRAILRASVDEDGKSNNVKLMFPMIGALHELRAAQAMLDEVRIELTEAEIPFDAEMEVGIMIEVPSAVAVADQLADEVDFFSIGTNDLTQYVMAADRGNSHVADLADGLQPAVLRLVQQTVAAGHQAGIWVGLCGELAGSPLAAPVLVGLGLDELSMSGPAIPQVKAAIRALTQEKAQEIAIKALRLPSATAVQEYLAAQSEADDA